MYYMAFGILMVHSLTNNKHMQSCVGSRALFKGAGRGANPVGKISLIFSNGLKS